jgi:RNase H-fold protein (predicted Holliday junction resolvase)
MPDERKTILGFDPGKDKCGVAVMDGDRKLLYHQTIATAEIIAQIAALCQQYSIELIVMGDQTTAKQWQQKLTIAFPNLPIDLVDERYSSLPAQFYRQPNSPRNASTTMSDRRFSCYHLNRAIFEPNLELRCSLKG